MALLLIGALGACAVAVGQGTAPQASTSRRAAGDGKLTPFVYGARWCANCHAGSSEKLATPAESAGWICQMNEYLTFDAKDRHGLAFKALVGERGKRMGELLGTDVTKLDACVNCHGVATKGVDVQLYDRETDGVTCVACHGASAEWVEMHQRASGPWRSLDRAQKESRYGMKDLWNPVRRAETCASCHIGNYEQGKVLTHAMYAAGHPPLPSLEVASYCDLEPRHWQTLREKTPERRARLGKVNAEPLEETRQVVLGGLVELRQSIKLLADQAEHGRPGDLIAPWPDFARFDCTACHHELSQGLGASPRQVRRIGGAPGRPTISDWSLALANLSSDSTPATPFAPSGSGDESAVAELTRLLNHAPFGAPRAIVPVARKAVAALDRSLEAIERTTIDTAFAHKVLLRLCNQAAIVPDHDSARQVAWAFRAIYRERGEHNATILRELDALGTELALDLPPAKIKRLIEPELAARLRIAGSFDARLYRTRFARIAAALDPARGTRTAGR